MTAAAAYLLVCDVVLHGTNGIASWVLEGDEVPDLGDRELLHEDPSAGPENSLANLVDIVDPAF